MTTMLEFHKKLKTIFNFPLKSRQELRLVIMKKVLPMTFHGLKEWMMKLELIANVALYRLDKCNSPIFASPD